MPRGVAETGGTLGVDREQVKSWAHTFRDYMSKSAKPTSGQPRQFTDDDLFVLSKKRLGQRIGTPIREWIIEFDSIDPGGTTFRYADDPARNPELWRILGGLPPPEICNGTCIRRHGPGMHPGLVSFSGFAQINFPF
jgi:hypothetical protein